MSVLKMFTPGQRRQLFTVANEMNVDVDALIEDLRQQTQEDIEQASREAHQASQAQLARHLRNEELRRMVDRSDGDEEQLMLYLEEWFDAMVTYGD